MNMNDRKALNIINEANKFADKYLSVDAIDQYTIEILLKYAAIQKLNISN